MRAPSFMPRKASTAAPAVRSVAARAPGRQTSAPDAIAGVVRRLPRDTGGATPPGARIREWWRRNLSPDVAVETAWSALPANVRQTYATIPNTVAEFSPGAAVRDLVNESGNLSRAFMAAKPREMLEAAGGMGLAALGIVPAGRVGKVVKAADEATPGIRAYHGSREDFDRFDLSKAGTGEGGATFGHGIYLAEHPAVAQQYRDLLKWRGTNWDDPAVVAKEALERNGGDATQAIARLEGAIASQRAFSPKAVHQASIQAIDLLKSGKPIMAAPPTPGRMYEVRINADRDKFLDWDRPLKDQPDHVRAAIDRARGSPGYSVHPDLGDRSVMALTTDLAHPKLHGSPAGASAALRDSGIPGIKYLDQGSRAGGAGTQNFVVFDDRIIQIMRKYGWAPAGIVAGGTLMTPPQAEAKEADAVTRIARACGGRMRRADGGGVPFNAGLLRAARPAGGRTDTLPVDVPAGCYVIPADIVSSLGEGDTEAGRTKLDEMFPHSARAARATGGNVGERVPIIAAGGEYIISPEDAAVLGNGDLKRGHDALDAFVKRQRAKTVKTLSKLPGPVR